MHPSDVAQDQPGPLFHFEGKGHRLARRRSRVEIYAHVAIREQPLHFLGEPALAAYLAVARLSATNEYRQGLGRLNALLLGDPIISVPGWRGILRTSFDYRSRQGDKD